jgi:hypothetical protein
MKDKTSGNTVMGYMEKWWEQEFFSITSSGRNNENQYLTIKFKRGKIILFYFRNIKYIKINLINTVYKYKIRLNYDTHYI